MKFYLSSFKGTKAECDEQENFIVSYSVDKGVDSKKNKSQPLKSVQVTTNQIRDENRVNLLESEVFTLQEKLKE